MSSIVFPFIFVLLIFVTRCVFAARVAIGDTDVFESILRVFAFLPVFYLVVLQC